ncbi:hypothetical protein BGZ68_003568, partial [Mortierella alpina]
WLFQQHSVTKQQSTVRKGTQLQIASHFKRHVRRPRLRAEQLQGYSHKKGHVFPLVAAGLRASDVERHSPLMRTIQGISGYQPTHVSRSKGFRNWKTRRLTDALITNNGKSRSRAAHHYWSSTRQPWPEVIEDI